MNNKYIIKLIMGGNGGVGKTTMLIKYVKGSFIDKMKMTIGLDFFVKELSLDSYDCILQMWDFGGQDRFRFLHDCYVQGAQVGVLLFDLTRLQSLENIPFWSDLFRSLDKTLPLILVGSKKDRAENMGQAIEKDYIFEIAEYCNIDKNHYIETSSKNGMNLDKVFKLAVKLAIDHARPRKLIDNGTIF